MLCRYQGVKDDGWHKALRGEKGTQSTVGDGLQVVGRGRGGDTGFELDMRHLSL